MTLYPFFLDILKLTVAGVGVVWVAFYLAKPYIERGERIQMLEYKKNLSNQTLSLRLQAFERLVLFIERINPANMILRLNARDYSAIELHTIMVEELRSEYHHNITQQIYVTTRTWTVVKQVKEQTLAIINTSLRAVPENATGIDLARAILTHLAGEEESPYDIATNIVRTDFEALF
jgi:hypothetical protein